MASYSMPSSQPAAITSVVGAAIAVPPTNRQLLSPTFLSFTVEEVASSGKSHTTFMRPSVSGSSFGACGVLPNESTRAKPVDSTGASDFTSHGSLHSEKSPKPSAFRNWTRALYSLPSAAPATFISHFGATKVVLPDATILPLLASTNHFSSPPTLVISTWDASTGGQAWGIIQDNFSLPGPLETNFGGSCGEGAARVLGSPWVHGALGAETSLQPSLFEAATIASYAMPSSQPSTVTSDVGAFTTDPPFGTRVPLALSKFWNLELPTMRILTVHAKISGSASGAVHEILKEPGPRAVTVGASGARGLGILIAPL
mmetsp:Transcript_17406/g.40675  ORF Transcript_17406/g.40675 Transcript_17406/m.40675 type:complete len:315 (-) Transcript_17406:71-1015(-)